MLLILPAWSSVLKATDRPTVDECAGRLSKVGIVTMVQGAHQFYWYCGSGYRLPCLNEVLKNTMEYVLVLETSRIIHRSEGTPVGVVLR
eukprot:6200367-Pleurochrysis_carterae.AAC.2